MRSFSNVTIMVPNKWVEKAVQDERLWLVRAEYPRLRNVLAGYSPTFVVKSRYGTRYEGWMFGHVALVCGDVPQPYLVMKNETADLLDYQAKHVRDAWQFSTSDCTVAMEHFFDAMREVLDGIVKGTYY